MVAGKNKKVASQGGVAGAMSMAVYDAYGPSQAALESWKLSGIPTSEVMQQSSFGLATQRSGGTAGDALDFTRASQVVFGQQPPQRSGIKAGPREPMAATAARPNPITWLGADEPSEPRRFYDKTSGRPMLAPEPVPPSPPQQKGLPSWHKPPAFQPLNLNEQQQPWGQLMRAGKVRQSAATCLIEMPAEYRMEAPPPMPPVASHAMNTIGLHPQNGGRPVMRSTAFTSTFCDPYEGL